MVGKHGQKWGYTATPSKWRCFGHEIIVWSWERQLPNAAQTLKVLICYGHTRSLGDCVPEHRVETDSLPETRNHITNTGLSFSRLRTHCTIAPLTKKKRHLGQLPFALQAAARAISLEVLPSGMSSSSHLKSLLSTIRWCFNAFPTATFYVRGIPDFHRLSGRGPGSESFMTGPMTWMISNGGSKRKGKVHPWFLSSPVDGSSQSTDCLVIGFPVEDVGFTISMSEDVWRFWDHSRFCCKHLPWKSFQQLMLDDFGTLIQLESSVVWSIFNFVSSALILLLAQPWLDTSVLSSFCYGKSY